MSKVISVGRGFFATIGDKDFERLGHFHWFAHPVNAAATLWYVSRSCKTPDGKWTTVLLHREITRAEQGEMVDHIDGDTMNNQRSNLRFVNAMQNRWNSAPRVATSRFKGVCWLKSARRWRAAINVAGKQIAIGQYESEEEAALAFDQAARMHHGPYARLNFPDINDYAEIRPKRQRKGRYRGVSWHHGKWAVQISVNNKSLHVGRYDDEVEAARAYDAAAMQHHGPRAKLNFGLEGSRG